MHRAPLDSENFNTLPFQISIRSILLGFTVIATLLAGVLWIPEAGPRVSMFSLFVSAR